MMLGDTLTHDTLTRYNDSDNIFGLLYFIPIRSFDGSLLLLVTLKLHHVSVSVWCPESVIGCLFVRICLLKLPH